MSGGDFCESSGGQEFGEENAGENESGAEEGSSCEGFVQEEGGDESAEDRLENENEDGLGGRQVLLGVALDGERGGGGEDGADDEGEDQRRCEVQVGVALEGLGGEHDQGAKGDLQGGESSG